MTLNCPSGTPVPVSVSQSPSASSLSPSARSTTTPPLFSRTDSSNTQDTGFTRPDDSSASHGRGPGKTPSAGVRVTGSTTSSSNRTNSSIRQHRHSSGSSGHSSVSAAPKVVYGAGTITRLPTELGKLGLAAPLIVSSPSRLSLARRVQALIPNLDTRILDSALVNVPQRVVEDAVARVMGRDSVISVGGASAMRLAKAIALRKGIPHVCIPTSYSGSESPLLGDVRRRKSKSARRGDSGSTTSKKSYSEDDTQTMPQMIIYDEDLTCTGPSMTISAPKEAKTPPGGRSSLDDDAQWSYIHLPGV